MIPAQKEEHAKYAMMGMELMRRDDKTQEEKLDFFRVMESRYPGIGWGKAGASLQKAWAGEKEEPEPVELDCDLPD